MIDNFNIQLTKHDLDTLNHSSWINDNIINYYFRSLSNVDLYSFDSFFYIKLYNNDLNVLRRWTRSLNIFNFRIVLIPIFLVNHWTLVEIDFIKKTISYYDSYHKDNFFSLNLIFNWIINESKSRNYLINKNEWSLVNLKNIPKQFNSYDCGVFCMEYARCISRKLSFNFNEVFY